MKIIQRLLTSSRSVLFCHRLFPALASFREVGKLKPKVLFARALSVVLLATAAPAGADIPHGLAVSKTVDHTNGLVGTYFQFYVIVTNLGPGGVSNIVVQESLPDGLQLAGSVAGPGSFYDMNAGTWSINNLTAGAAASLNVTAQIVAAGPMTNTATITSSSPPGSGTGRSASVMVFGLPTTGLAVLVNERNAEGKIVGPLAGATVLVPGLGSGATDARGQLLFTNIPAGTYSVTVTNAGFYPVSHTVIVAKGQMPFEGFELMRQSGPGAPSEFDFTSPQGNYFIPAMPGNLSFSVMVAWNGTPGSVVFNVAGTQMAATLTDQGNGTARATLTIPALSVIAAASELTVVVTNGEGLSRAFNLGAFFEPLPGTIPSWFTWLGNSLVWVGANAISGTPKIEYNFKKNYVIYSNSLPGDSITLSSSVGVALDLSFTPKNGTFNGSVAGTGIGNLEVKLPGVAGIEVSVEGKVVLKGTVKVAFAGLNPPAITPGWGVSLNVKNGLKAPAVAVVPVVLPFTAPAVTFLQNTWGLKTIVNSLKLGMTISEGGQLTGVYQNPEAGTCFLRTTSLAGSITAGMELEAAAKLGRAKMRIYGGGNGTVDLDLCPQLTFKSLTLEAYAGISASVLYFSYDKKFSAQLKFGGSEGALSLLDARGWPVDPTGDWEPIGNEVQRWGEPNQLADPQKRYGKELAAAGSTESLVVSNVLDLASPSAYADPSETFILLTLYDPLKPWHASTDIGLLRQTNGGPWSLSHVTDDLMADFTPKLTGIGTNLLLAAWERVTGDVSGATNPVQVDFHLEIVAAWFDRQAGAWSPPVQLTTNSVVDRDPLPVSYGAAQAILWVQNQAGAGTGDSTNGDSLLLSQWSGSSWSPPQTLWSGPKGILSFSFVKDGSGEGHVVFAVDQDGSLDTQDDRELYGLVTVSAVWQPAVRLTSDLVEASLPTLVAPNGVPRCVWNQGGTLVHTPLNAWNPQPVFIQTTPANHTPTLEGVTLPGGAAVAYAVSTLGGVDTFASFYNATQNTWSLPRPLTQDRDVESSVALAFNGTNLVVAYEKTQTVFTNLDLVVNGQTQTLTNVPQPGRTDLYVLTHAPGSDPGLVAGSLTVEPPNPAPGSNATLSAVFENFGDAPLQNVPVAFYDGDPQQGGIQIGSTQIIPGSLIGGATQQVTVAWTVPAGTSPHSIYVVVDPALTLNDRDRSNNTASQMTVLPDLIVDTSWNTEAGMTTRTLIAQVVNQGVIASGTCVVSWRLGDVNGEELARNTIGSLAPGQSVPVTYLWNTSGRQFSTAYVPVYVVADSTNAVPEFDESNNDSLQMVPVVASWVPRITSITRLGTGAVQLTFAAANSVPSDFVIESNDSLINPLSWQPEPGAVITATAPGVFQVQVLPQGGVRFYRVRTSL